MQIDETRGPSQTGLIITVRHLFLSPCRVSDDVRDSQEVAAKKKKKKRKKERKKSEKEEDQDTAKVNENTILTRQCKIPDFHLFRRSCAE